MTPIPNYEDCYAIKEDGSVIRLETGRVLKPCLNKQNGYLYVSLWKNNVGKAFSVHRLVANAYIPNPDNKPEVNHISSNRADPRKENLEWATRSENVRHGYTDGHMSQDHRKNFHDFEMALLLQSFLAGETMTTLAIGYGVSLTRLSIHMRKVAQSTGIEDVLEAELYRQKCARNVISCTHLKQPVLQYTKDGVFVAEHAGLTDAAKAVGAKSSGSISNAMSGRNGQRYAQGFLWKFK